MLSSKGVEMEMEIGSMVVGAGRYETLHNGQRCEGRVVKINPRGWCLVQWSCPHHPKYQNWPSRWIHPTNLRVITSPVSTAA